MTSEERETLAKSSDKQVGGYIARQTGEYNTFSMDEDFHHDAIHVPTRQSCKQIICDNIGCILVMGFVACGCAVLIITVVLAITGA